MNDVFKPYEETDAEYDFLVEEAKLWEERYDKQKNILETAKVEMDEAKKYLVSLDAKGIPLDRHTVRRMTRKGNVDMKKLQIKYDLMDSDIDACRKDPIDVVSLVVKK